MFGLNDGDPKQWYVTIFIIGEKGFCLLDNQQLLQRVGMKFLMRLS